MGESRLISIVDDDTDARDAIQELVESLGYAAISFRSAEDFLQSGCVAATACLISDIQMPGLDGLGLQRRLRAEGRKTPIIFVTAHPEKFRARALAAGALGFLGKPFLEESLIDCLKVVFSGSQLASAHRPPG
jgi:FixJ family two-component response regulator